jgi:hypothetical protein
MPSFPKQGKSKRNVWTPEQRAYVSRAVEAGCLICDLLGYPGTPAQWHHAEFHMMGMRGPHESGFALCPYHHDKSRTESVHLNPANIPSFANGYDERGLIALSMQRFGWPHAHNQDDSLDHDKQSHCPF